MAKDKLTQYDSTASNNTDVGGISVAEGMLPSGVNNAIREQMSHLADFAAGTSGVDVLKLQDDTDTNSIKLQAPSSVTADTTFTLPDGDGSADQVLKTDGSGQLGWADRHANPSLIINGAMQVAQRGTSFTATGSYPVDRFSIGYGVTGGTFTVSQDTASPSDFTNSIKYLTGTAASAGSAEQAFIGTTFEGYSTSHLNFGTSDAKNITLSFWVRSSVTGTYCVAFINNAFDRSYIAEYSISSADTWEYKTITVSGDTSGTWAGAVNTRSMLIRFDLGSGSSFNTTAGSWQAGNYRNTSSQTNLVNSASATWYITGVKLEVGSTATDFVHESYGDELARCQRYYMKPTARQIQGVMENTTVAQAQIPFLTVMRAAPTVTRLINSNWGSTGGTLTNTAAYNFSASGKQGAVIALAFTSSSSVGIPVTCDTDGILELNAEL